MTTQQRVLVHLAEHQKGSVRKIAQSLDLPVNAVCRALGRLQLEGRVIREGEYRVTGEGQASAREWAQALMKEERRAG